MKTARETKLEAIKAEMKKAGLSFTGCYSTLPDIILTAIDTVNTFGFDYWTKRTTSGPAVKEIVKAMSNPIPEILLNH